MRKFEVRDIGDYHYRQLLTLVRLGLVQAHIVVKSKTKIPWPQTLDRGDRKANGIPTGEAIN
jgi:hypothetical protein